MQDLLSFFNQINAKKNTKFQNKSIAFYRIYSKNLFLYLMQSYGIIVVHEPVHNKSLPPGANKYMKNM